MNLKTGKSHEATSRINVTLTYNLVFIVESNISNVWGFHFSLSFPLGEGHEVNK